ncbi:MAG: hypothetical protein ACOZF0_10905 [Thermodesulfobacteriota bacterium]
MPVDSTSGLIGGNNGICCEESWFGTKRAKTIQFPLRRGLDDGRMGVSGMDGESKYLLE